jgi:MFS family permease
VSAAEPEPPPITGLRAVARVLRQRDFFPFFVGNAVSASGTWFQNLAASLLVYRLTGSALLLGVLNFAQFAAILVLAPWTGSVADRFDRRKLALAMQSMATVVSTALAVLAFTHHATTTVVILASLVLGVVTAFSTPAQMALVSSLVEPRDIQTAVSLNSMTFNIARATGPVLAAVVIDTFGIPTAFALNSLSYLVLIAALLVVRPRRREKPQRAKLRESLALVRREPRLALLLIVVATVGFASDPVNTLAPAFATHFGFHDVVGGYMVGAFGIGAVAAAFVIAGRQITWRHLIVAMLLVVGGIACFALSPSIWVAFLFLPIAGFGYLFANSSSTARLQLEVHESQRGRIMALWSIAFLGLRPFASLVDGAVASTWGVRTAGVVLTLPAVAAVGVLVWHDRRRAEVRRPQTER